MSDGVLAKLLGCLPVGALLVAAGAAAAPAGPAAAAGAAGAAGARRATTSSVPDSIVAATRTITAAGASLQAFTQAWLAQPYPPAPKGACKTSPDCLAEHGLAVTAYVDLLATTHSLNPNGEALDVLFTAAIGAQATNLDSDFVTLSWTTPVSDPHEVYVNWCDAGTVPARRCLASGVIASMQSDVTAWETALTAREALQDDTYKFEYASQALCLHSPADLEYPSLMAECVQALKDLSATMKALPGQYAPYVADLGKESVALGELAAPGARLAAGQKPEKQRSCAAGVGSDPTCGEPS
ncbi:MAG TPA: hypothetical protein VMD59_15540 [Acidimicrobiales bacterium]|nr:hypothetical protein [Acidimicrobiales bacterium]